MKMLIFKYNIANKELEFILFCIVAFACLLFSSWTLSVHIASFFSIPWQFLSRFYLSSLVIIIPVSLVLSAKFSKQFLEYIDNESTPTILPGKLSLATIIVAGALILFVEPYALKFLITAFSLLLITCQANKLATEDDPEKDILKQPIYKYRFCIMFTLILLAVLVNLLIYHSDFDDSNFLDLVAQTMRHPQLPPLTFDETLGYINDQFRFAPYRIASYETLIALISDYSKVDLLTVYYQIVPSITAGLTICVAYLFSRAFLSTNRALLSTSIFLLIMLAWGDTSIAYGSRVFVRLYQGKGLLIALTTPITIIAGLMLIQKPTLQRCLALCVAQVVTLGVSSSGLVLVPFTSALVMLCAFNKSNTIKIKSLIFVGLSLIYPTILVLWLKFFNHSMVSLSEAGTYLPINSSLGLNLRSSLTMIILLIGFSLTFHKSRIASFPILVFLTIFLIFNPWLSNIITTFSALNMSWRLGWATPLPLFISIALSLCITPLFQLKSLTLSTSHVIYSIGLIAFIIFLSGARWVITPAENMVWSRPKVKVPPEYYTTQKILEIINKNKLSGAVLATSNVAAWIPLLQPKTKLVMPGHTFPVMLQTILSPEDFAKRMQLFWAINSKTPNLAGLVKDMEEYHVGVVVLDEKIIYGDIEAGASSGQTPLEIKYISTIDGYVIYKVIYE